MRGVEVPGWTVLLTGLRAHGRFQRKVCAVEHGDCASRGAAGSHEWAGRTMAPSRKAESAAEPIPSLRSLGKLTCKGLIMEHLEIIDLGDAMTETRCTVTQEFTYDSFYGPRHWTC